MRTLDSDERREFGRPTWLEIDLERIRGNYHVIRGLVPSKTRVLCVVKDDAYGHGAERIAAVLQEEGADWFALSTLDEALELRSAGIAGHMLVFGSVPVDGVRVAIEQDIALSVPNDTTASEFASAVPAGKHLKVHLKIDTGMGRNGVLSD